MLPVAVGKFGEKTGLICCGNSFTFAQLNELSARLGNALRGIGVGTGDRVTLYSQNCWEWVVSYYAISRVGAVVNPINIMLTPREVLYVVRDCGAKAILAPSDKAEALLDLRHDSPLERIVLFEAGKRSGAYTLSELLAQASPHCEPPTTSRTEVSTIAYTSGTTGYPKGAVLTHGNVLLNTALTATMHVRNSADTVVTSLPTAHVYGNVVMNSALLCGMTLVLIPRFDEVEVLN